MAAAADKKKSKEKDGHPTKKLDLARPAGPHTDETDHKNIRSHTVYQSRRTSRIPANIKARAKIQEAGAITAVDTIAPRHPTA